MNAFSTRHCSKRVTQQAYEAGTITILISQLQKPRPLFLCFGTMWYPRNRLHVVIGFEQNYFDSRYAPVSYNCYLGEALFSFPTTIIGCIQLQSTLFRSLKRPCSPSFSCWGISLTATNGEMNHKRE